MAVATLPKSTNTYLRLAAIWPPHVPRDDGDYEAGAEAGRSISARAEDGAALDEGEAMYLEAVLAMLASYDAERSAMPVADLALPDRLRGLLEATGTNQSNLAEIAGVSRGNMSDVMAGRRGLSKDSIKRLSRRFGIAVDFFF